MVQKESYSGEPRLWIFFELDLYSCPNGVSGWRWAFVAERWRPWRQTARARISNPVSGWLLFIPCIQVAPEWQFEIIICVFVSFFQFTWIPMLLAYDHYKYFNSFSLNTSESEVYRRQNLTYKDGPRTEKVT